MTKVIVRLNDFNKIKKFIGVVGSFAEDIDLIKNRYVIDAKSTMGIFTLDLSEPVTVAINTDESSVIERFIDSMKEFE